VKENIVAWLSVDIVIRMLNAVMLVLVLVLVLRCLSKTLEYSICIGDAVWLVSELLI
jgi:hypothetical protein